MNLTSVSNGAIEKARARDEEKKKTKMSELFSVKRWRRICGDKGAFCLYIISIYVCIYIYTHICIHVTNISQPFPLMREAIASTACVSMAIANRVVLEAVPPAPTPFYSHSTLAGESNSYIQPLYSSLYVIYMIYTYIYLYISVCEYISESA